MKHMQLSAVVLGLFLTAVVSTGAMAQQVEFARVFTVDVNVSGDTTTFKPISIRIDYDQCDTFAGLLNEQLGAGTALCVREQADVVIVGADFCEIDYDDTVSIAELFARCP